MIEFIFSALLVPLLPALADPAVSHDLALKGLQARLNQAQLAQPGAVAAELLPSEPQPNTRLALPAISGRLFDWSKTSADATGQPSLAVGASAQSLRLTGLIETSGQYVGILNDGEKDHVVGVGSYVMDAYRVVSLGKRRMVLMPLDKQTGAAPLELGLLPGDDSRGFQ